MAGVTTFLTMAYIIFVNPSILADAGMDKGAICCHLFGSCHWHIDYGIDWQTILSLLPLGWALTPFLLMVLFGHGAYVASCTGCGFPVGVIFLVLSVLPVRHWIVNSIPQGLKMAISAGIGLFLAIIALKNGGVVVDNPATLVGLGDVKSASVIMFAFGFSDCSAVCS